MIEQDGTERPFQLMRKNGFHSGSILDMSSCLCRPCIATVGTDHTIRIWNYLTWECEISFDAEEDPLSVSIHPSGFHVLVGFKERVRMYNVLRDTIKELRSMPIKHCRELRFSTGGNMFAVAYGINLEIYDTNTFSLLYSLNGHIRPIRQMTWMDDGQTLYSVGMDGACMGWDACSGTKIDEETMAPNTFSSVAVDRKRRMVVCATTAGEIYDVRRVGGRAGRGRGSDPELMHGTVHKTESSGSLPIVVRNKLSGAVTITRMMVTRGNDALLCGMSDGAVRIYPWPLLPGKDVDQSSDGGGGDDSSAMEATEERAHRFTELRVHGSAITGMELTHDDTYLFTTSEDGSVFVHELTPVVNGVEMKRASGSSTPTVDDTNFNVDAVLVSKEDMDEQMLAIQSLTKEMLELKSDTEYALHVK
jgi:WD40 repeat protein